MKETKWDAQMLVMAACCIAMSFTLSYFKVFSMANGGSVTVASMVPLMIFSYLYGVGPGMLAGLAYGLLQYIQKPFSAHILQILLDYPMAFAAIGLAGLFRGVKRPWGLPAGVLLACFGRFVCHLFAGVVYFGVSVEGSSFAGNFIASAAYNGPYMAIEAVVGVVITSLPIIQRLVRQLGTMNISFAKQ